MSVMALSHAISILFLLGSDMQATSTINIAAGYSIYQALVLILQYYHFLHVYWLLPLAPQLKNLQVYYLWLLLF